MILDIDKNKTMCVTGHRNLCGDLQSSKIKEIFIKMIDLGITTFLIGMAVGFDTLCFQILEKLRLNYPIKIIACVPCPEQDKKFNYKEKEEYSRMLGTCDEKIILSPSYTPYCMMKRNRFMVDNSDFVLIYLREQVGGTFSTAKYAEKLRKNCIYL